MVGEWAYSEGHGQKGPVIETQTLWGETVCRVWLPGKGTVVRLPAGHLRPVNEASVGTVDGIGYFAFVAREIPNNVFQMGTGSRMWCEKAVTTMGEET